MPPRADPAGSSLPRASTSTAVSIYPTDSVQDVAESLGLPPLKESVAAALAADVEYRLRQVIQDAGKFMRHGQRSQMRLADVDRALKQRNIEPIFGFHPTVLGKSSVSGAYPTPVGSSFRRVQTQGGPIHIVSDEEIDLDKVLENVPKVGLGPGVGWSAHWLAIEGVQPAVPQNPVLAPSAVGPSKANTSTPAATSNDNINGASAVLPGGQSGQATAKPLIKHVLSRELQLYFERLTNAILNPPAETEVERTQNAAPEQGIAKQSTEVEDDVSMTNGTGEQVGNNAADEVEAMAKRPSGNTVRDAALASLRGDSGLHQLVPYLIQWVGEKVQEGLRDEKTLGVMLQTINAIVMNPYLGIEAYLHQLLPFVLSILLTSTLGSSTSSLIHVLRSQAASLLTFVAAQYGSTYPTLQPRLIRTMLSALDAGCSNLTGEEDEQLQQARQSPGPLSIEIDMKGPRESAATKLGALIGLRKMGRGSMRTLLVQDGQTPHQKTCHLKRLGNWCAKAESIPERRSEVEAIVQEVKSTLLALTPPLSVTPAEDTRAVADDRVLETFGAYWMARVGDSEPTMRTLQTFLLDLKQ